MCVQTTLFRSLRRAWRVAGQPVAGAYLPGDGAVLSPHVEVFRRGTAEGYETLPVPVELACVVSIAMPHLSGRAADAPTDGFKSLEAYRASLRARWRAALHAACLADARCVVCPDAGCGVYGNDPKEVGTSLGKVLREEYWARVDELVLAGGSLFATAVEDAAAASSPRCPAHLVAEESQASSSSTAPALTTEADPEPPPPRHVAPKPPAAAEAAVPAAAPLAAAPATAPAAALATTSATEPIAAPLAKPVATVPVAPTVAPGITPTTVQAVVTPAAQAADSAGMPVARPVTIPVEPMAVVPDAAARQALRTPPQVIVLDSDSDEGVGEQAAQAKRPRLAQLPITGFFRSLR